jgi:hypothetical protein
MGDYWTGGNSEPPPLNCRDKPPPLLNVVLALIGLKAGSDIGNYFGLGPILCYLVGIGAVIGALLFLEHCRRVAHGRSKRDV